jgi:peptidoglycan/LPS O-acetylase OafA/YrhL
MTKTDISVNDTTNFLGQLHGLRGILSIIVVVYHFNIWFNWSTVNLEMLARAVDGFVVLSGFIIARTMLPNIKLSVRNFLLLRWIRLSPTYYIAVAAIVISSWGIGKHSIDFADVTLHILYVHNFFNDYTQGLDGAFWSVGLEMSLYVMFALMVAIVRRFSVSIIWLLIASNILFLFTCLAIRLMAPEFTETFLYGRHLFSRWIQFTLGVWLFLSNGLLQSYSKCLTWLILLVLSIGVVASGKISFLHNYFWAVIIVLMLNTVLHNKSVSNFLSHRGLQWFGSISYPMYLIHGTVFYLCSSLGGTVPFDGIADKNLFVCLSVGSTFIIAHVLTVIESRSIRLMKKKLVSVGATNSHSK